MVVAVALTACRSEQDNGLPTDEPPQSTGDALAEVEEEPPEKEVTRIVVETEVVEVTPEPTPIEPIIKELIICVNNEPESLYPYANPRLNSATEHILQSIYEPLYTSLSYDYQARGLEKIPSLADGDATIQPVQVSEGDRIINSRGDVVVLREGVRLKDIDGEIVEFTGEALTLPQLVVNFTLKPAVWSDGEAVTADDSVYSFELASDPQTPVPKRFFDLTQSYKATGELTLEWVGIPGYLDKNYFTNVWPPYPRHFWGQFTAGELLEIDPAVKKPLSSGPFSVIEWVPGDHILLEKNEFYYRSGEELPLIDKIRFRFVPSSSQVFSQLLSGECDIAPSDTLSMLEAPKLIDAERNALLTAYLRPGTVFEHIDFGINPVEEFALTQPDWFQDRRVRQAIVMCTDRQRMVDELLFGRAEVLDVYVPSEHPLVPEDLAVWPYDIAQANALLDAAGYPDEDEDGLREDRNSGTPFVLTLFGVTGNDLFEQVASIFQENLADCGIQTDIQFFHADQYFADGPDGPLFGRKFDLAAFPWLISIEPNCGLYLSSRIPAEENNWNRGYNNETGFSDDAFDAACEMALSSLPGLAEYEDGHQEALRIWAQQLPIIPLFMRLNLAATRPEVQNFVLDPTQQSELWNLAEIDLEVTE
jgi:peptide/nickel transport system substrate-binding protein